MKDDRDIGDEDVVNHKLTRWGDPSGTSGNSRLVNIADELPIGWDAESMTVSAQKYGTADHPLTLIFPNPLKFER